MQYCSLQHWTLVLSPVPSTTGCCFFFGSVPSFFLEVFLHWSPVAYWAPTDLGNSSFNVLSFCLFMESSRQEYWSGCHSLHQRITFCQTSLPWPVHLGWPYTVWLIVSLSQIRLWSMWAVWLFSCDCSFHFFYPLIDKDRRLMEASWWQRLTEGETGPCSDGQSCAP